MYLLSTVNNLEVDANDPSKVLSTIFKMGSTQLKSRKCFLFADMGMMTKNSAREVHQFLVTIKRAHTSNWYVIFAPSSGVGWRFSTRDVDACRARQFMHTFELVFYFIVLKNWTSNEALFYIRMINAAKEGEEKSFIISPHPIHLLDHMKTFTHRLYTLLRAYT